MKVVIVNYWNFDTPSGMHIFHLANALAKRRVDVTVYCRDQSSTALSLGKPKFRCYGATDSRMEHVYRDLAARGNDYVLHAWTPRESTRVVTELLAQRLDAPYIVHMEDNEDAVYAASTTACTPDELAKDAAWSPGGKLFFLSHPVRYKEFLASAQGYTSIIESLQDFKPAHVSGHVFWPSCEPEVFALPSKSSPEAKIRWGIPPESPVIFYPGNVHHNNADEVKELYIAVRMLREQGIPARIIKFGRYSRDIPGQTLAAYGFGDSLIDLTTVITPSQVPEVLRAADYLVQPGRDTPFNHYRFPCKLPLFMASGRPVMLPDTNLGRHLEHEKNCLILQKGDAKEICKQLLFLARNPDVAESIGQAGREFAKEHFSWDASAAGLIEFYRRVLEDWKGRNSSVISPLKNSSP